MQIKQSDAASSHTNGPPCRAAGPLTRKGAPICRQSVGRDHLGAARIMLVTNTIESLHMLLRKITKRRSHFPSDEAGCDQVRSGALFALSTTARYDQRVSVKWARNQLTVSLGDRLVTHLNRRNWL